MPFISLSGAPPALDQLRPACTEVFHNESTLLRFSLTECNKSCVVTLEQSLLDMFSRKGVCFTGVYMLCIRSSVSALTRIIETDKMIGFSASVDLPAKFASNKYRVYGPAEFEYRASYHENKSKSKHEVAHEYLAPFFRSSDNM